ncbi:transcriptional regulator [Spirochaeta dissipatitropha]
MIRNEAGDNFNKARTKEVFSRILNLLKISDQGLLSLDEVRSLLKPKGESYRGLQAVSVSKIVGSEGRYRDFNKRFLPRHDHLRNRWIRVDEAHLQSKILPPIQLYEIGGVYFVRDGNHRVSVAALQGVMAIDAEVISLSSEISIDPGMTKESLRKAVIDYEKQEFYKKIPLLKVVPDCDINFSATGRYAELVQHIYGHKYYINQNYTEEIPVERAILSWYENVYRPITEIISENGLLIRFPKRTAADLYVWTVRHWHELKEKCGEEYPVHEAILNFSEKYGMSWKKRATARLRIIKQRLFSLLRQH